MADISKMREYREELIVVFLSGFNPKLGTQIQGQILGVELVLFLQSAFSKVLRIFTATPAIVPNQSAMVATVVVIILREEDDIVVSIVASLVTDLTGTRRSLASHSGHLVLLILLQRRILLCHPLVSFLRQYLSLMLTMKISYSCKPTSPLLQHYMLSH